jgi:hypothetical protein
MVIIAGYFLCNKLYIVRIVKPIICQLTIYKVATKVQGMIPRTKQQN